VPDTSNYVVPVVVWKVKQEVRMAVRYEARGRAAVVTIDRPDVRNAVDLATAEALHRAWLRFDDDEEALVGVLTGSGENFSAGVDLKTFDVVNRPEGPLGFTRCTVLKPTIAAIAGFAVAGGLEMALWCDLRVAGEGAVFGCFERRFGIPMLNGGTQRLPRVIGQGRALDMILTGRPVDAQEAHRIGLVDRLVPAGSELEAALELAETIADSPQETVRSDRLSVYEGLGRSLDEGLAVEDRHGRNVMSVAAAGAARFAAGEGRGGSAVA
jgi:enoyl-CoA hydratase